MLSFTVSPIRAISPMSTYIILKAVEAMFFSSSCTMKDHFRPHSKTDLLQLHFSSLNHGRKADLPVSEAISRICK